MNRGTGRGVGSVLVAFLVALLVTVSVGGAEAGTSGKPYTASIQPRNAAAGGATAFLYTITDVDSQQQLGSARILIPTGWAVGSASIASTPAGKTWRVNSATSTLIEVVAASNSSRLGLNQAVVVSFSATAACAALGTSYMFESQAHQANQFQGPNNEFFQQNSSDPDRKVTLSAGAGAVASLSIDPIGPKTAGAPFSVTTRAYDACGNPTVATWPSTLSGSNNDAPNGTATASYPRTSSESGPTATYSATVFKAGLSTDQAPPSLFVSVGPTSSPAATFDVAPGPLHSFTIDTIASPQKVGSPFAVKANAFDRYGNKATNYAGAGAAVGGSPAAPLGPADDGTPPTYGAFGTWSGGSATASVTAVKSQLQRKVRVSDGSVSADSNAFDVADEVCTTTDTCSASVRGNTTVRVDTSNTQDFIALQLLSPAPVGGTVTECGPFFTPDGYGVRTETKTTPSLTTVTFDISKAVRQASTDNGLAKYNVCFGGVDPGNPTRKFPLKHGFDFTSPSDPNIDDLSNTVGGQQGGVIPDCTDPRVGSATSPTYPCLQSTQSVGGGARIVFLVPSPWDWTGRIG